MQKKNKYLKSEHFFPKKAQKNAQIQKILGNTLALFVKKNSRV